MRIRIYPIAFIISVFLISPFCIKRTERVETEASTITILYPGGDERILSPYFDDTPKFLVFLPLVAENDRWELEGSLP